jgi:hypothetical protein
MSNTSKPYATHDWSLNKGSAIQLEASQVRGLEAMKGTLWVTISGSSQDIFLRGGQTLSIPYSQGQVVVEPLDGCATARVAFTSLTAVSASVRPSAWQSALIMLLHPIASALRVVADWLDPKFGRA